MYKDKCGYWVCATHVGIFLATLFIMCFLWFYIQPDERMLHESLFNLSFLGWSGMNFPSLVLGILQSFIWGYIVVGLWYLSGCCHAGKSCGECKSRKK
jgi:hypothetical protein